MTPGLIFVSSLLGLLAIGTWVAVALFVASWIIVELYTGVPAIKVLPTSVWGMVASWPLTALPMFIWMGEILFRTRLADDMFKALAPLLTRLPGRHLHLNVVCCGIFAAVCGSSAATAATIGRITLPELGRRGYNQNLSLGSLAASGSLGMMIPPSIPMIVYGISAEVSIARLFIAGVIPGLVLMALFMAYLVVRSLTLPEPVPVAAGAETGTPGERAGLARLVPVLLLIVAVIGSIYTGIATPTEAAVVGVAGSLAFAMASGALSWPMFHESLKATLNTSLMIMLILAASAFLTTTMGLTGIPRAFANWIAQLGLSHHELIVALAIFFTILGCFLDGISMIILTAAVILPAVDAAGIDLLWFGVFMIVVIEMAQLTPPVGFNLFVVQGITGIDMWRVAFASMPFFFLMVVMIGIITVFPDLVTMLPNTMMQR